MSGYEHPRAVMRSYARQKKTSSGKPLRKNAPQNPMNPQPFQARVQPAKLCPLLDSGVGFDTRLVLLSDAGRVNYKTVSNMSQFNFFPQSLHSKILGAWPILAIALAFLGGPSAQAATAPVPKWERMETTLQSSVTYANPAQ